jgi:hypothetical protein
MSFFPSPVYLNIFPTSHINSFESGPGGLITSQSFSPLVTRTARTSVPQESVLCRNSLKSLGLRGKNIDALFLLRIIRNLFELTLYAGRSGSLL